MDDDIRYRLGDDGEKPKRKRKTKDDGYETTPLVNGIWTINVMDADGGNIEQITPVAYEWAIDSFDWWTAN